MNDSRASISNPAHGGAVATSRRIAALLLLLSNLLPAVFVITPYLAGDATAPLQNFAGNQFLRITVLPIVLLCLFAWVALGRWLPGAANGVLAAVLLLEIVSLIPAGGARPAAAEDTLRVGTYNARRGWLRPMISTFVHSSQEIMVLQEISVASRKEGRGRFEQLGYRDHYVTYDDTTHAGILLLSTYPILSRDTVRAADLRLPAIEVDVRGTRVYVVGVHLASFTRTFDLSVQGEDWRRRAAQVRALLALSDHGADVILLVGDFNSTPADASLRGLRREFVDAWLAGGSGYGPTWPETLPVLRIDYVFFSGATGASRPMFASPDRSDHLMFSTLVHLPRAETDRTKGGGDTAQVQADDG